MDKDRINIIIGVLLTAVLGYCAHLSATISDIKEKQADMAKYIVTLDNHSDHLVDLEQRVRCLEKGACR